MRCFTSDEEVLSMRMAEHWSSCQGGPGVPFSEGHIPNPPGGVPVSPALGGPALVGGWTG